MRILVSLPVHEHADLVHQQLENLFAWLQDPVVVLHLAPSFDARPRDFEQPGRVLINPQRCATAWSSGVLARVHYLNLVHAMRHTGFDYAALHASNELFVRGGVERFLRGRTCGSLIEDLDNWSWKYFCRGDRALRAFCRRNGLPGPFHGQVEGSFFRRDLLQQMMPLLGELDGATQWRCLEGGGRPRKLWALLRGHPYYPREEVWFTTALAACGQQPDAAPYTYMNWERGLALSREEVDEVRAGGPYFAVKRVERQADDPLRKYVHSLQPLAEKPGRD